jgi:hypothetical protein
MRPMLVQTRREIMRKLCLATRNHVRGNLAVLLTAAGVFGTGDHGGLDIAGRRAGDPSGSERATTAGPHRRRVA